jgi:hypothetical protein
VTYRLNGNVSVTVEGGRNQRESTAPSTSAVPSTSFVDRRVMLLLGYSSGPLYEVRSRR